MEQRIRMIEAVFWLALAGLAFRVAKALVNRFGRREPAAPPPPVEAPMSGEPPRPELATDAEVLRFTLDLVLDHYATVWQPAQRRLKSWKPHLTPAEVDAYTFVCQEVRETGTPLVTEFWNAGRPEEEDARAVWEATMLARYPWLSEVNLRGMWAWGSHMAWRDGLLPSRQGTRPPPHDLPGRLQAR